MHGTLMAEKEREFLGLKSLLTLSRRFKSRTK